MPIVLKRAYEQATQGDGYRVLVDRIWPRGISKDVAKISYWAKSVAPSNELRKWNQHDPAKWDAFRQRYFAELDANPDGVAELREAMSEGSGDGNVITFVFSSKETRLNNAAALKAYLEDRT